MVVVVLGRVGADLFCRCPHPNWDDYRQAMNDQDKSIIRVTHARWSPVSRGGFPPELFEQ